MQNYLKAVTLLVWLVVFATANRYSDHCAQSVPRAHGNCREQEKLIFYDDFDTLDTSVWKHEITLSGGGNGEFQVYLNNRSVSYAERGTLHLHPRMTNDVRGIDVSTLSTSMDLWGGLTDGCTSNSNYGCLRTTLIDASGKHIVNPVVSARLVTLPSFSFRYGRVEVRAKLPLGDWLWPAIWMLPMTNQYGTWPASGEIDIMESRGNRNYRHISTDGGVESFCSTLHWGPYWRENGWSLTHGAYHHENGTLADEFHVYGLYWSEKRLYTYIDSPSNIVLDVDMSSQSFWNRANAAGLGWNVKNFFNPWQFTNKTQTPFDQEYFIILNLAVGGNNGYFPDSPGKPWKNGSPTAMTDFWDNRAMWQESWKGVDAALKVDFVKVWAFPETRYTNKRLQ